MFRRSMSLLKPSAAQLAYDAGSLPTELLLDIAFRLQMPKHRCRQAIPLPTAIGGPRTEGGDASAK